MVPCNGTVVIFKGEQFDRPCVCSWVKLRLSRASPGRGGSLDERRFVEDFALEAYEVVAFTCFAVGDASESRWEGCTKTLEDSRRVWQADAAYEMDGICDVRKT